jgi:hypothetical protein
MKICQLKNNSFYSRPRQLLFWIKNKYDDRWGSLGCDSISGWVFDDQLIELYKVN